MYILGQGLMREGREQVSEKLEKARHEAAESGRSAPSSTTFSFFDLVREETEPIDHPSIIQSNKIFERHGNSTL